MISLIGTEIKKLFRNKFYVIVFVALLLIPTGITFYQLSKYSPLTDSGDHIGGIKDEQERLKSIKAPSGEVTESWLEKAKEQYDLLYIDFVDSSLDEAKMEEVYGKNWRNNQELYDCIYKEKYLYQTGTSDACPTYYNDINIRKTKNSVILGQYQKAISFGEFILNKGYQDYNRKGQKGYDLYGNPIYVRPLITPQEKRENNLVMQGFHKTKHFYYGETYIIRSIIETLKLTGVPLGLFLLLLFSSMFSKEKNGVMSLIKTTKKGKYQLTSAKILTTLLVGIVVPLFCIGFVLFTHILVFGMPDWKASFTLELSSIITHFTTRDVFWMMSGLYIVGSLTIAVFALTLSNIFHSSYHSLMVGFTILILGLLVLDFHVDTFFLKYLHPFKYMHADSYLYGTVSSIGNYTFYNVPFILSISTLFWILLLPINYYRGNQNGVSECSH